MGNILWLFHSLSYEHILEAIYLQEYDKLGIQVQ